MSVLPYVTAPGNIDKALNGIKSAAVPERVSQDFVKTILKIPGGSGDQMTAFLRKLGLTNLDGTPNEIYKRFRNPTSSKAAIASVIKQAYAPLFVRNEFAYELSEADLTGLVVEETGQPHDSSIVKLTVSSIKHLKGFADFGATTQKEVNPVVPIKEPESQQNPSPSPNERRSVSLNLGYTINLNLPATSDPEVFDAIFRSLKEHLLRDADA